MSSNIFNLNWENIAEAVVSAVVIAVLSYISNLTTLTSISWHTVLIISIGTAIAVLMTNFGTDANGAFAGVIPVK